MKKVLVLCTGNSCRSQLAEGFLRHFTGANAQIYSAGIEKHGVNPKAVAVMAERGIDISAQTSNLLDEYQAIDFDYLITVCDHAREGCPLFITDATRFHFNFPDPAKATGTPKEIFAEFRKVRDEIETYCADFVKKYLSGN